MTRLRTYLPCLALIVLAACATTGPSLPYRACLFDKLGRFDHGKVIALRVEDDARLFQFDDESKGDHGFRWVTPGDVRVLKPCIDEAPPTDDKRPPVEPLFPEGAQRR